MMFYLAGPVDDVDVAVASGWRDQVAAALGNMGHISYSPHKPWHATSEQASAHGASIDAVNRQVIVMADAVIANLAGAGRGFGTLREIEFATSICRPVLVFTAKGYRPVAFHDLFVVDIDPRDFMDPLSLRTRLAAFLDILQSEETERANTRSGSVRSI